MSIRVAAQRYPGPAPAGTGQAFCRSDGAVRPGGSPASAAQLAQIFWLAVREEKLGDGVGVVLWAVPAVSVVVP
jgi:hypothetical protein